MLWCWRTPDLARQRRGTALTWVGKTLSATLRQPFASCEPEQRNSDSNTIGKHLQVFVRDNNVEQALRVLKKKMQREGVFREMKRRKAMKNPPSARRARKKKPSGAGGRPPGNRLSATV